MFDPLKLAWSAANPLTKIKFAIYAILATVIFSALSYAAYRVHEAFLHEKIDKVVIQQKDDKIVEQRTVINQQSTDAVHRDQTHQNENKAIVKLDTDKAQVRQHTDAQIAQVKQQIIKIDADPKLTQTQKEDQQAQVEIDSLWDGYCDAAGSAASGCPSSTGTSPASS